MTEPIDLASPWERAFDDVSPVLTRAAIDLGAEAIAVLLTEGPQVEIAYHWSRFDLDTQAKVIPYPRQDFSAAIRSQAGPVDAANPLAQLLRDSVSPRCQSFLLFHWRARPRAVAVVFAFAAPEPPSHQLSTQVVENLNLVGLATWSVKEVGRLRAELKTVSGRLAERKLVERAKGILQVERGFSEEQAYAHLRSISRSRRVTLTNLAKEVLRAGSPSDPDRSRPDRQVS